MPLDNLLISPPDCSRRVIEQRLLLRWRHQSEKRAGLRVIVIIDPVIPVVGSAFQVQRRFRVLRLLGPLAVAVGLVGEARALIAVDAHLAVTVVAVERAARRIDRDLRVVDAEPIALGIAVGE
ncbi:hypothetical protein D3C76_1376930 [compost metagenome]